MKGLLLKEWYLLRKYGIFMLILAGCLIWISLRNDLDNAFGLTYIPMLFGMLPVLLTAIDEASHWEEYACALPYSRKMIVTARYLISLMMTVLSLLLMSLPLRQILSRGGAFDLTDYLLWLELAVSVSLIFPAVMHPVNFRFGSVKGRFIMCTVMVLYALLSSTGMIATSSETGKLLMLELLHRFGIADTGLILVILLIFAVMMLISWGLSVAAYERRQF